ncbi:MAG: tripartite tricarboxylate transporter TctB family protein [Atribacterota bacterium]|jgi:hypothetical protein|nr:tripartite tricarboxylate transporter TctB family protein [Atribacterota bacterium]MDD4896742.1 tripartite tricarboxylate transporter TctB family protein [Atribacterota bacterium]MDD5636571.1 tripartite tricarboxylate transporter TctB family protein [Atribacterota bacterium]
MNDNQENRIFYRVISLLFVALVITIVYFDISGKYLQQGIKLFTVDSPLIFPFLVFFTLIINFIFELRNEIKKILNFFSYSKTQDVLQKNSNNIIQTKELLDIFIFTVISIIYVYILPRFHFIIATGLYMFVIMVVVNESDKFVYKLTKSALATAITIPLIYYVFYGIFEVILP